MLASLSSLSMVLLAMPLVSAHGMIISHFIRGAGAKSEEVCGSDFNYDRLGKADGNNEFGPISPNSLRDSKKTWKDPEACNWRLCSGNQYEDNKENTYYYPAGANVPINVFILNRHPGVANVSIVDTKTNEVIGEPLIEWTDGKYAQYDHVNTCPNAPPESETAFNVTIPDLGDRCTKGGDCVVQWYWYSRSANNQSFNSCVDFVQPFGGSPLPPMVEGRPDVEKHHAYCSQPKTTTVYDTATLLNEATSPKTLVSVGGEAVNTPAPTMTPTGTASSATVTSTGSVAASANAVSAADSATPSNGNAETSAPATTAATATESTPANVNVAVAAAPSTISANESAPAMTAAAAPAEESTSTTVAADAAPTTTVAAAAEVAAATTSASKSATVCKVRPQSTQSASQSAPAVIAAAAVGGGDGTGGAKTITVTATTTATENGAALATTTVIEKVYVFMEAVSTSTAELAAPTNSAGARRRHIARRRLSATH